jgi:hypothetical protein
MLEGIIQMNGIELVPFPSKASDAVSEHSHKDCSEAKEGSVCSVAPPSHSPTPLDTILAYTTQSFTTLTSHTTPEDKKLWWEFYFERVNSIFPFYTESWFESSFQAIPLHVLHIMYATILAYPGSPFKSDVCADLHLEASLKLLGDYHEYPSVWSAQTIVLIAVYSVFSYRVKTGMAYLAIAIRMAQTLSLDIDSSIHLQDSSLKKEDLIDFGRSLWSCINSLDYHCYFLCGVDFMIPCADSQLLPVWSKSIKAIYNQPKSYFFLT